MNSSIRAIFFCIIGSPIIIDRTDASNGLYSSHLQSMNIVFIKGIQRLVPPERSCEEAKGRQECTIKTSSMESVQSCLLFLRYQGP